MCLVSTPSIPTPQTTPPAYLHNTFLDNPAFTGGSGVNAGRNSLVIPLSNPGTASTAGSQVVPHSGIQATPQVGGGMANPFGGVVATGLQAPGTGSPGLQAGGMPAPMVGGRPALPMLGGAFAGAIPSAAPLAKST